MRIRTLAACLFLTTIATACTGELTDDPGTDPGTDPDGGGGGGGGSGSNTGVGDLTANVDKATIDTELFTSHDIKVTLTGTDGFTGSVGLAATVTTDAGAAATGWTVSLAQPSVSIAANGTADVVATVKVPSTGSILVGNVNIVATSGTISKTVSTKITALNQLTYKVTNNGAKCDDFPKEWGRNDPNDPTAAPLKMTIGTKLRIMNMSTTGMEVHANNQHGVPHQKQNGDNTATLQQNQAYEKVLLAPAGGINVEWYCHVPGAAPPANRRVSISVVAP